jgi:hypothetical protein
MVKLVNRAKMSTATTGTGTITLGTSESGYQSFADAGVVDGDVVRYVIEDGDNWEIGTGTYTASGTTLTRTVSESSNAGAAISLSGTAVVFVSTSQYDVPVVRASDPVVDTNPPNVGTMWVNSTSGSVFVCTDNTTDNNYWFEVNTNSNAVSPFVTVEYLIAAGGGAGGYSAAAQTGAGAGGAGGLLQGSASLVSGTYNIVVGAGGIGALNNRGGNGGDSTALGLTAIGGGGGATFNNFNIACHIRR